MKNLGQLFRKFRLDRKLSLQDVANEIDGYDAGNLSRFERGLQAIQPEKLDQLCSFYKVKKSEIYSVIEKDNQLNQESQNYEISPYVIKNLEPKIPLLSWDQARNYSDVIFSDHSLHYVTTSVNTKMFTFALKVEDDLMIPVFSPGMIIVVEPEMPAINGDFVVEKDGQHLPTLKQLIQDGAEQYLKPLNNRYPIKPLGASSIIGVVREALIKFK